MNHPTTQAMALGLTRTLAAMLRRLATSGSTPDEIATTMDTLTKIAVDALEDSGLDSWAEDLANAWVVVAGGSNLDLDHLIAAADTVVAEVSRYLDDEAEARTAADEEAATIADLLTPNPWGQATPLDPRDQNGDPILPGYIVSSQAENMAGQVIRVFTGNIDGPAPYPTTMVEVIPNGGGRTYSLAAEEVLVVWSHAPLATATPAYSPLGDAQYRVTTYRETGRITSAERHPDETLAAPGVRSHFPAGTSVEVYDLGHWEQMVTGIALDRLAEVTRLANEDTAAAVKGLARVWSIPQTTVQVRVTHLDD